MVRPRSAVSSLSAQGAPAGSVQAPVAQRRDMRNVADGRASGRVYAGGVTAGRAFFVYTGLRLLLLLAVGGLLYLTGARGLLLLVLAFLVSGALSLVWLDRPRSSMSQGFGRVVGKVNDRIDAAAAAEDDVAQTTAEEDSEQQAESDAEPRQQQGK
mgnify:FL=1